MRQRSPSVVLLLVLLGVAGADRLLALDPQKNLSQYTRTEWTQVEGLPQETIRAIQQTPDGYLWLGTAEGLARFDGYEFVAYSKDAGYLPGSSIISLAGGRDGALWVGTSEGLAHYSNGTFTAVDGIPREAITCVLEDHRGILWVVSGGKLRRIENGKISVIPLAELAPVESVRVVHEDEERNLWVGGVNGVVRRDGDRFVEVVGPEELGDGVITSLLKTDAGLWLGGSGKGLIQLKPDGSQRLYTTRDGLPHNLVLEVAEDQAGSLWVGTYGGLSRMENGRFSPSGKDGEADTDWVWSLFEDREGNLWVGTNGSLIRLRDDEFTMFGQPEGLPSDQPTSVYQEPDGTLWISYRDRGLVSWRDGHRRQYTTRDGLPSNEIYRIRAAPGGDLLISTMGGGSRVRGGSFVNYVVPDPADRTTVLDFLADSSGYLWAATPSGVYQRKDGEWRPAISIDANPSNYTVVLSEGPDQSIWAGTFLSGLWRLNDPANPLTPPQLFTKADGLGSDQIRALVWDDEGVLWVGAAGGGLTGYWNGQWHHFGSRDGLSSDNVSHIHDDGLGYLWLSTTRGICRVSKQDLRAFSEGKIRHLNVRDYGTADGLRSPQAAPTFPSGGGGIRTQDGRLWFTTGKGLAVIDPSIQETKTGQHPLPTWTHILGVFADDKPIDTKVPAKVNPGSTRFEFRYVGINLSTPEAIRYWYKLDGLEADWIPAQDRRLVSYNYLPHGDYTFRVRAELPGSSPSEAHYAFSVLPRFYETRSFVLLAVLGLAGSIYGVYRLRLARVHSRFEAVFDERARLAREIHDTLAQGFVGISHQLDALASKIDDGDSVSARQHLTLARRMTRHSLTEARRSMMDLRMSELHEHSLSAALATAARRWVAGTSVDIQLKIQDLGAPLSKDLEQNVFRIAQEAVVNAIKHAKARTVSLYLAADGTDLCLCVGDDGDGFDGSPTFSGLGGHFGIVGMRERAERFGGTFSITSVAGAGTQVKVTIPLESNGSRR